MLLEDLIDEMSGGLKSVKTLTNNDASERHFDQSCKYAARLGRGNCYEGTKNAECRRAFVAFFDYGVSRDSELCVSAVNELKLLHSSN